VGLRSGDGGLGVRGGFWGKPFYLPKKALWLDFANRLTAKEDVEVEGEKGDEEKLCGFLSKPSNSEKTRAKTQRGFA